MKIVLVQNLYFNPRRDREHRFCLERNHANERIEQIILATAEDNEAVRTATARREKIRVIETGRDRETYADMFELAEQQTESGDIIILANLDIFFDDSIQFLYDFPAWDDTVMALTRWDYRRNGRSRPFRMENSQDVWIWRAPLDKTDMVTDFAMGEPGCDNRIAYEFSRNYRVINPSRTIRGLHYHESGCSDYTLVDKVPPPYKVLPRTRLRRSGGRGQSADAGAGGRLARLFGRLFHGHRAEDSRP